jgi:hypothetical protein
MKTVAAKFKDKRFHKIITEIHYLTQLLLYIKGHKKSSTLAA